MGLASRSTWIAGTRYGGPMTDRPQAPGGSEARISELVGAGLIERRNDDLGRFVVQLTPAGEELARAVVDADATMDPEALLARLLVAATPDDDRAERDAGGRAPEPLTLKGSFGTALGSAMLGFEQALRREPPAEDDQAPE